MLELESSRGSNPDLSKKREVIPEAKLGTKVKGKETRRTTEPRNCRASLGTAGGTKRRKDHQEAVNAALVREA
jgi:hypothetical protein